MNEIIKKNGITFGIITGVISILITASVYIIDLKLFTAWWLGILSIGIYLGIGIYLLSKTKKELGGIFPFKDAFTTYFISAVIGIVISVLFNIVLFNVIDTEAKDTVQDNLIEFPEGVENIYLKTHKIELDKKITSKEIEILKKIGFKFAFNPLLVNNLRNK